MKYDNELKREVVTSLGGISKRLREIFLYQEYVSNIFDERCVSLNAKELENINQYIIDMISMGECIACEVDRILQSQDDIKLENRSYKISDIIQE